MYYTINMSAIQALMRRRQTAGRRRPLRRVDRQQNRRISRLERSQEVNVGVKAISVSPDTGGVIVGISQLAQGDTNLTREGNKVIAKRINLRLRFLKTVATTDTMRVIIFADKEQHGTIPTLANVLQSVDTTSHLNINNKVRFRIFKDMIVNFSSDDAGGPDLVYRQIKVNLRNMPIFFIGTAADDASAGKNNLYLLAVAFEGTTFTTIIGSLHLFFTDS